MTTVAVANPNVAIAKYWGKRNEDLNLPYTGSISITMSGLQTSAGVSLDPERRGDQVRMNNEPATAHEHHRIATFLDLLRTLARSTAAASVDIRTDFPVAAGLASSASTFAALAVAATHAFGLSLTPEEVSVLARRGSGSAARSIFGGFAEWLPGEETDGSDSHAIQLASPSHWPLGIVVAITDAGRKRVGSREGMAQVVKQSPFFPAWLASHDADLDAVRRGVLDRDISLLGQTAEHNCLKMHAVSMAARPALLYWNAATIAVMHRVRTLREEGLDAYFTIDAGPQVKIICPVAQRPTVAEAIERVAGVQHVLLSEPGSGAHVVEAA